MTVAKNLNAGLHLNQPLLGLRERELPGQQKAGYRLNVTATKETPGTKFDVTFQIWSDRTPHVRIL